jgi:N-acetylglucosamine-6-sulfatase
MNPPPRHVSARHDENPALVARIRSRSLMPVLKNDGAATADWRKAIHCFCSGEATHRVAAHDGVRNDRYKLFYLPKTDEWQLFDLEKDPKVMKSVHDDPAYADVLEEMKATYQDLRAKYKVANSKF